MTKAALYQTYGEEQVPLNTAAIKSTNLKSVSLEPVCIYSAGSDFSAVILKHTKTGFQIILAHPMPRHSMIVADYDNDLDVIADWRFIGKKLNLPLLSLSGEGYLETFSEYRLNQNVPRRFGSPLSGRRTRFSCRRKMGEMKPGLNML